MIFFFLSFFSDRNLKTSLLLVFLFSSCCFLNIEYSRSTNTDSHFHTLPSNSLFHHASRCTSRPATTRSGKTALTMQVFHRHGPCYQPARETATDETTGTTTTRIPPLSEVLSQDQNRVEAIQARLEPYSVKNKVRDQKINLPAKSGSSLGSGNYLVTVGMGSPAKPMTLIFDTGSDLTWTQCQPCVGSCYKQQGPIFNPSTSSSYSNISCNSAQCSLLSSATGHNPGCLSGTTCIYLIQYGDQSFSVGYLSKDKLTLSATDSVQSFLFGCGQNNKGLFGAASGILGLGRDPLSFVSQTSDKYKKYFSYCLPSTSSSTGHLTIGKSGVSRNVKFTPFASSKGTSFYFIDIIAISVGGVQLPISLSVFKAGGSIIDSGTVITRLPPAAYTALSSAFKKQMTHYPSAPAYSILDTCFDFSNFTTLTVPTIGFTFGGNVKVDLDLTGILVAVSSSSACLAFAGNSDAGTVAIFGNTQQKTLEVVFDVAAGNLGLGSGGCS